MSSPYFSFSALTKFALARAEAVNAIFQGIDVGFGKLPDPDALNQQRHNYVVAGGSANVITVSLPKAPAAYVEGLRLSVKITATTTTDATINVNGLGAKAIVRANGDPTAANDLVTGQIVDMQYDGSVFRLIAASEVLAAASAAAAAASATAAGNSASDAATSATNAHNSELAAAASATAAAAANKVAKAGDTMTGDLILSNAALRVTHSTSVPSIYLTQNGNGFSRIHYAYTGQAGALFALRDETAGVDRLTIDAAGVTTLNGGVYMAGGIARFSNTTGDEKGRLVGTNPYFSAYDATEATRRGYLQWNNGGPVILASDVGGLQLVAGGVTGFILDGNKDITGPRGITASGTVSAATFSLPDNVNGGINLGQSSVANPNSIFNFAGTSLLFQFGGVIKLTVGSNGNVTAAGNLGAAGAITSGTQCYFYNDAQYYASKSGTDPVLNFDTNDFFQFNRSINALNFYIANVAKVTFDNSGLTVAGTLAATGVTVGGSAVWHAGNFDPTLKAPLASPALTGTPTAPTAAAGTATTQLATTAFADRLRDLPGRTVGAANAFVASDRGGHVVAIGAGGFAITLPSGVFGSGAVVVIINDSSGNITIARSGVVMRWAATGADADRTLAPGGMATIIRHANGSERFIISGAGLS